MPGANRHGNLDRRAINQHLWVFHQTREIKGDLFEKLAQHDLLHVESGEFPYAGKPKHRHVKATAEFCGEVVLHEGEGT